jgi:hypothetical protein
VPHAIGLRERAPATTSGMVAAREVATAAVLAAPVELNT